MIEQALFTKRPGRSWDERPAAQTAGLDEPQADELAAALRSLQGSPGTSSEGYEVSFLRLSQGSFCVAKTVPAAGGGFTLGTILAHCLVVDPETLGRYSNNPFALLNSVLAEGWLRPVDRVRPRLNRFTLEGSCGPLDTNSVADAVRSHGLTWFEAFLDTALANPAMALPTDAPRLQLMTALFHCLPVECRTWFPCTTGPVVPEQTTFRLFCLENPALEASRASSEPRFAVLDLRGEPQPRASASVGWCGLVSRAIGTGRIDWLADQLRIARPALQPETLDALGNELLQTLAILNDREPVLPAGLASRTPVFETSSGSQFRRPDVAHEASPSAFPQTAMAVAALPSAAEADPLRLDPSQILGQEHPAAMQTLEQLDDVVFEAIAGKPAALDQLRELWPAVIAELGRDLLEESQSQYLRHAMSVWKDCIAGDELRNPRLAVAAAEVVSILLSVA